MKEAGMLVFSLRGVNFGFWSQLGCSGQNAIIFSRGGVIQGCTRRNIKNIYLLCIFLIRFTIFARFICLCFNMDSFRGEKSLGHAQIGLL